jgi:hypothetical protein
VVVSFAALNKQTNKRDALAEQNTVLLVAIPTIFFVQLVKKRTKNK